MPVLFPGLDWIISIKVLRIMLLSAWKSFVMNVKISTSCKTFQ